MSEISAEKHIYITNDPAYFNEENNVSSYLKKQIERCYGIAMKGKKSDQGKILAQIDKFPKSAVLKNYLSVWYKNTGSIKKANELTKKIIVEHPDYLFGKINHASQCLDSNDLNKIPLILGKDLLLSSLYPERDTFHISEFLSFERVVISYYIKLNCIEEAEDRLSYVKTFDLDQTDIFELEKLLILSRLNRFSGNVFGETKNKIVSSINANSLESSTSVKAPLFFNHPEIEILYSKDLRIEEDLLDKILCLPKVTLIEDLILVLEDSILRCKYYFNYAEENNWEGETVTFVIHAIFILGELETTDSLPIVLNILRQDEDYIDLFFGDFISEVLWEPILKIAKNELDELQSFVLEPGIYTYSKGLIGKVILQIALNYPNRRSECTDWFDEVFSLYANSTPESNIIDSEAVGLLVSDTIDLGVQELLPQIEKLFELEYVSLDVAGNYFDVEKALKTTGKFDPKLEILPVKDRYNDITNNWYGYLEEESEAYESNNNNILNDLLALKSTVPIKNEAKIGRNDPCICGSGKKYKKCCA